MSSGGGGRPGKILGISDDVVFLNSLLTNVSLRFLVLLKNICIPSSNPSRSSRMCQCLFMNLAVDLLHGHTSVYSLNCLSCIIWTSVDVPVPFVLLNIKQKVAKRI